jgi:hypothetical protein
MSDPRPGEEGEKRGRIFEDIFIILCILSLWPTILHWRHPFFEYLLYVALIGLIIILFRRLKRFRQARDDLNR